MRGKLLFDNGMVWDFKEGLGRLSTPEDRLFRHCPGPMPVWVATDAEKEKVKQLVAAVKAFFLAGGKDLQPPPADDVM
jgi:hypothetical protein